MNKLLAVFIIILFFLSSIGNSQSLNDYGTISSGNYNDPAIWRQWDGNGWNIIPTNFPDSSLQNVYIRTGHIVILPSPGPYNSNSLIVQNGSNFSEIYRVNGNNLTNSITNYFYYDYDNYNNLIYYKLKQIDLNGNYEEFPAIVFKNTLSNKRVIKIVNLLGQEIDVNSIGIKIIFFDDGTFVKIF